MPDRRRCRRRRRNSPTLPGMRLFRRSLREE
jgi:hypothetical protein